MSVFKSPEGRDRLRARYAEILDQFPFERRYVETPAGRTFVIEAGDKGNPPVVLLHGSCGNSAFWLGDIFQLAGNNRVVALDIPGEAGNSDENRLDLASDASVLWLDAALDALGVFRAALIGNSFGGWMALKYASSRPERVAKLMTVGAAGVVPPSPLFSTEALEESVADEKGRKALKDAVTQDAPLPEPVAEYLRLIGECFLPMTEALPLFPDEVLKALIMPSLFVFGERDATMNARAAAERLKALLPGAETRVLEGQGHVVMDIARITLPLLTEPPELRIIGLANGKAALVDRWARIKNGQDLLDSMATAGYLGCTGMIAHAESLGSAFFDLKTGVAGEMLQKFSNYKMRLAVIGDFSEVASHSLRDFIRESNRGRTVCFTDLPEHALAWLAR